MEVFTNVWLIEFWATISSATPFKFVLGVGIVQVYFVPAGIILLLLPSKGDTIKGEPPQITIPVILLT